MRLAHPLKNVRLAFLVAIIYSCHQESNVSAIHISNMQCEYLENPLGIDALSPRLSWQLNSSVQGGGSQIAYRILVASTLDKLNAEEPDLWDSKKVLSNQSRQISYQGKELSSRIKCYWMVKVWDEAGMPTEWSEPAFWTMGLLDKKDWNAQWIGSRDTVTSPFYRSSFYLEQIPETAMLFLASLGYFELYLNGKKVGTEVLAPAVSNYSKRTYYNTYDVAHYLKQGKNSIGIWMGRGWYKPGLPGVVHHSPVVRAQLELDDQNINPIITDSSWTTKPSERTLLGEWKWGKFGGEQIDARLLDNQWWDEKKSTEDWYPVIPVETADVPCIAQKSRNNIQLKSIVPVTIESLDDTTAVVDFGTNLTGMMEMKLRDLDYGIRVTIHYADLDGRDSTEAWRVKRGYRGFATYNQRDQFISAGQNNELFNNKFNYHGFRYALIEGLPYLPSKEDLLAIPVETKVPEVGSFSCSNELYNQIHKMVRWTYRALNLGGQTVDCPHRERLGYGDGQTIMDVGNYNFDASTLYTKWSENWWDEQKEDGFVPFVAPTPHKTGGGPAWGAMSIVVPWKTYLFYEDLNLLQTGYPYMKKYMDYLNIHTKEGILQDIFPGKKWPNLGDWVPPNKGMDKKNWVDDSSRQFFNNCYRAYLLQIMIKIGTLVGMKDDVVRFKAQLRKTRKAVHNKWYNPTDSTYANGEQPYLIFPLKTEITPPDLREGVFEKYLHTLYVENNGHLNTGMIGTQMMFDYLLEIDRNDLIDLMVNRRTFPGWGYMIEKGATTCWEQWNGYYSQIHSCFPYIGGWFYRGLAGIQWDTASPGFKNTILKPALVNSVDWVSCNYESPYGQIISNWNKTLGDFEWEVRIPPNTTAMVYIPGEDITVNGVKVDEETKMNFESEENGSSVFKVQSGNYLFKSTL